MAAVEKVIEKIRALPPEHLQIVSDLLDELDDDAGLEEQKKTRGKNRISWEEMHNRPRIRGRF